MEELDVFKIDLETPHPNPQDPSKVRKGDPARIAFTKVNSLIDSLVQSTEYISSVPPLNPKPYMRWLDISEDPPVLKRRNVTNTAWVNLGSPFYDTSALGSAAYRNVGEAAGNVLEVGAFGLGGHAPSQTTSHNRSKSQLVSWGNPSLVVGDITLPTWCVGLNLAHTDTRTGMIFMSTVSGQLYTLSNPDGTYRQLRRVWDDQNLDVENLWNKSVIPITTLESYSTSKTEMISWGTAVPNITGTLFPTWCVGFNLSRSSNNGAILAIDTNTGELYSQSRGGGNWGTQRKYWNDRNLAPERLQGIGVHYAIPQDKQSLVPPGFGFGALTASSTSVFGRAGVMLNLGGWNNHSVQCVFDIDNHVRFRRHNGTEWGGIHEFLTTLNCTIVENANGITIRRPDGLQICLMVSGAMKTTIADGPIYRGNGETVNYPSSFVSGGGYPHIDLTASWRDSSNTVASTVDSTIATSIQSVYMFSRSLSQVSVRPTGTTNTSGGFAFITATGKWKL